MSDVDPSQSACLKMRKAECSECGGIRNCDICGEHAIRYDDGNFQGETLWYILKCRGCDHVFVQTVSTNSEDYDIPHEEDGPTGITYNETISYWPALSQRKRPKWMRDYGIDAENVDTLNVPMRELYGALDNDLRILAAIGIRTAYDIASELLGIDSSLRFEQKLDALVTSGRIGVVDKNRLEMVIDAGSASAHRGWRPTASDLDTMMDVLEHFIHDSFVVPHRRKELDEKAAKVKGTVPPRPTKAKGTT
jgi:hypothetical protein